MTPAGSAAPLPAADDAAAGALMPHDDTDPAHSPDDQGSSNSTDWSSSTAGMDELLPAPDTGKLGKGEKPIPPEHHADAKEDESVGAYYLGLKNWHAALSRFESALVLDPENPEVYWGMAEAQRNLKQFADAKQNYLKVLEYDPGSKHAKEARKILLQPELESAAATPAASAPPQK
jgi:tetratricopeptide (TPR) repeat protein